MPEPGKSDKWNSLLETLGVPASESPPKPPEAAAEPPKAAPAPPPRAAKPAPKPKAAPPAAKSPSYWSRIAGALGLESAPAPEPPPAPSPPPPAPVAERPVRSQEPAPRPRLESMFGPKEPDVDVFALDQGGERSGEEPRQPAHREPPPGRREPPPGRREPPPSRREPPPARSAAPPRSPPAESLRSPPAEVPRRESAPPAFSAEDDEGFVLDYEVEGDSDLNLVDEPAAPVSEPGDEDSDRGDAPMGERRAVDEGPREGRRRRGRRRGRGRGGRRDEGPPPATPAQPPRFEDQDLEEYGPPAEAEFELDDATDVDEASDLDLGPEMPPAPRGSEADERLPPRRPQRDDERDRPRRGRRGGRGRGRDRDRDRPPAGQRPEYGAVPRDAHLADDLPLMDDEAADVELAGDSQGDEGAAPGHPTHKKIPTWQEAVGILIDANIAARADRPDRDRGRGGGGGGGGRGRGGRGRGGRR